MSTLYEDLGVTQDTTYEELKKAYRIIVLKHHPDKSTNLPEEDKIKNEAITKTANNAWEILGDPQRRREYDQTRLRPARPEEYSKGSPYNQDTGCKSAQSGLNSDFEESPSQTPRPPSPPRKYPTTLSIISHDWDMSIAIDGDYEPYDWGPGRVYCEENRVFIYMKIRESDHRNTYGKPHVDVQIHATPGMQRIHKIESLYKHRMQPNGADEQLLITIFLEPDTKDEFTDMDQYDQISRAFKLTWDVHAMAHFSLLKPPKDIITHGTCLNFFTRRPCQQAMFVPKPGHPDNPRSILLRDSDFKPNATLKFTGTAGPESSWITLKSVTRGGTRMYKLSACAWQELGQGKGEREKVAKKAYRW
jgi:hypothetical protein